MLAAWAGECWLVGVLCQARVEREAADRVLRQLAAEAPLERSTTSSPGHQTAMHQAHEARGGDGSEEGWMGGWAGTASTAESTPRGHSDAGPGYKVKAVFRFSGEPDGKRTNDDGWMDE